MELSSAFLPTELPWLEISIALFCVTAAFSIFYLSHDVERPIDYEIAVPEQCKPGWTGKVLEQPSIKVILRLYSVCGIDAVLISSRSRAPVPSNAIILPLASCSVKSIQQRQMASTERYPRLPKPRKNGQRRPLGIDGRS